MDRSERRQRRGGGPRTWAGACAILVGLLGGCSSDEPGSQAANRAATRPAVRPAATTRTGTTDEGSRLVDFTAPLGALTVETPPVRVQRRSRRP
jgi:hypothetical protein